jgi:hypothetical protein
LAGYSAGGFAKEVEGTVVRISAPDDYDAVKVYFDTDNNKLADTIINMSGVSSASITGLLYEYIEKGSKVIFDDEKMVSYAGFLQGRWDNIISVDGISMVDMFPHAEHFLFPYAFAKRAREQGGRSR